MSKPTEEELKLALAAAAKLRESGEDTDYLGKSLLNIHYRFEKLETVYRAVEHYLNSGMGEIEHDRLTRALREYRRIDRSTGEDSVEDLPI